MANSHSAIGFVFGGGDLPFEILDFMDSDVLQKSVIVVIAESTQDVVRFEKYRCKMLCCVSFAKVGKIIGIFKKYGIIDICFVGGVKKPAFRALSPDLTGILLIWRILRLRNRGDDAVLKTVMRFLEGKKFNILSPSEVNSGMLSTSDVETGMALSEQNASDIEMGAQILRHLSEFDIGQSIVVQDGVVLGIEAAEGTDVLIVRCGLLATNSKNRPVLIKMAKISQDLRVDMPTIGKDTLNNIAKAGFAGVAIEKDRCLIQSRGSIKKLACDLGLFIYIIK